MPAELAQPPDRLARAARALLLAGGFLCLAGLVFSLRRFAGAWNGTALTMAIGLGAASSTLIASAFVLQPVARILIAITLTFTVALAFAAETAIGWYRQGQQTRVQRILSTRTGTPFDPRNTPDVVNDLRRSGMAAGPAIVPTVILQAAAPGADPRFAWTNSLLPLAGISGQRAVLACNEDGQFYSYDSDEHGFANPAGSWTGVPPDIALIGDSFTHGFCVAFDASYAARLRALGARVLNLGTGGSGPLAELATLTEYAAPVAPKIVVWQYCENDPSDLANERENPLLRQYLTRGFTQNLIARQSEIDRALKSWSERLPDDRATIATGTAFSWRQVLTLYRLRELVSRAIHRRPGPSLDDEIVLFQSILIEARDRVEAWGGRLVFVYVPSWERYFQPPVVAGQDVRDRVIAVVKAVNLPLVDLDPMVRSYAPQAALFARLDLWTGHFSAVGYDRMAQEIWSAIRAR